MPERRAVLAGGSMLLAGLGGCVGLGNGTDAVPLETYEYSLINHKSEPKTFHWAFETEEGLGEWVSQRVGTKYGEAMDLEQVSVSEVIRLHVIVDDVPARADLRNPDGTDKIFVIHGTPGPIPETKIMGEPDPEN
ncbi:hypothetical protein [Natronomonas marina]|uniref:hypothetical protein n=1 Tax=Natronomonas marina TaxID=2961939 RepID=UPI0020C9753A|nr:hypothetical protein [Natronomonas marina]